MVESSSRQSRDPVLAEVNDLEISEVFERVLRELRDPVAVEIQASQLPESGK